MSRRTLFYYFIIGTFFIIIQFFSWQQRQANPPSAPIESASSHIFLPIKELPGWYIANSGWLAVPEGEGEWSAYERKDSKSREPWGKFTHYLFLFDTIEAAQTYYLNPTIPLSETGEWLEQISYRPNADEMLMRCLPINEEEGFSYYACEWWARYGRRVTKVEVNLFEREWLTAQQFKQLLREIDGRMR